MKKSLFLFLLFFSILAHGQTLSEITPIVNKAMEENKIPGLALVVIKNGAIAFEQAYGLRDRDNQLEVNLNTPFQVASISKTVLNMVIFKLYEEGKLALEVDINQYLPFKVENPHFPDDKITIARLLKHRSGIYDDYEIYGPFWGASNGDPTIPLEEFFQAYLTPKGKYYRETHFASSESNLNEFRYSNTGYGLLGLIVEQVAKESLEDLSQRIIFQPLDMKNTSWFLKNLEEKEVAKPYTFKDSVTQIFKGHNGYPDYPAGQLRTSATDFSKLLLAYLDFSKESKCFLSPTTRNKITPSPGIAHNGFYTWFLNAVENSFYYGHGGGDTGVSTYTAIDVDKKNAIIIFTNTEGRLNELSNAILKSSF